MKKDDKFLEKLFSESRSTGFVDLDSLGRGERIPTASPSVNWVLQGGIVPGKFYALAGPPSSGKSMFAFSCVAKMADVKEGLGIWYDAEKSFDGHWLNIYMGGKDAAWRKAHLKVKEVDFGPQVFDFFANEIQHAIEASGLQVTACVLDSVQSIIPPAEANTDSTEDVVMAGLARYLPGAMRKIITPSRANNVTWFFICQVREKMDPNLKGMDRFVIPGGNAFHHFIDCVLMMVPSGAREHKILSEVEKNANGMPVQVGHHVNVKAHYKCRVGVPGRMGRFKFLYKQGIVDTHEEIADLARNLGMLELRGSNFYYESNRIANGVEDLYATIKDNPELASKICERAYA